MCLSEREPLCSHQVTLSFLYSECAEQELLKFPRSCWHLMVSLEPGVEWSASPCGGCRQVRQQVRWKAATLPFPSSAQLGSLPLFLVSGVCDAGWESCSSASHTCTLQEYYGTVVLTLLLSLGFCWHYVKAVLQSTGYLLGVADGLWWVFLTTKKIICALWTFLHYISSSRTDCQWDRDAQCFSGAGLGICCRAELACAAVAELVVQLSSCEGSLCLVWT